MVIPVSKLIIPPTQKPVLSDISYPAEIIEARNGWIDPDGWFYPCGYGAHDDEAYETHVTDPSIEETREGNLYGFRTVLERRGWIGIQREGLVIPDHVSMDDGWYLTRGQFNFINDYLGYHSTDDLSYYDFRIR